MKLGIGLIPLVALAACSGSDTGTRDAAPTAGQGADAGAQAGRAAADGTAPEEPQADAANAIASDEDEPSVEETAAEYIERTSNRPDDATVPPEAVGAVPVCTTCHGAEGEGDPVLNAPRIGGMEEWYLARQLKYFKQGIRAETHADVYGTQMRAMALTLENDAVIEGVAAHFAVLDPAPAAASVSGDAAHGEELYTVCAACHGESGGGNADLNTPSMVGQDGGYLVRQLQNYRSGIRGGHELDIFGQQMQPIVESALATDQDIVDVVAYIVTLEGGESGGASPDGNGPSESTAQPAVSAPPQPPPSAL